MNESSEAVEQNTTQHSTTAIACMNNMNQPTPSHPPIKSNPLAIIKYIHIYVTNTLSITPISESTKTKDMIHDSAAAHSLISLCLSLVTTVPPLALLPLTIPHTVLLSRRVRFSMLLLLLNMLRAVSRFSTAPQCNNSSRS